MLENSGNRVMESRGEEGRDVTLAWTTTTATSNSDGLLWRQPGVGPAWATSNGNELRGLGPAWATSCDPNKPMVPTADHQPDAASPAATLNALCSLRRRHIGQPLGRREQRPITTDNDCGLRAT